MGTGGCRVLQENERNGAHLNPTPNPFQQVIKMGDYHGIFRLAGELDELWIRYQDAVEDPDLHRRVKEIIQNTADLLDEILDELEESVQS